MTMRFNSVLLVVTERCRVGCEHCGYRGGRRDREMTVDDVPKWVAQIAEYGVPGIIVTGGEPFERMDLVTAAVREAESQEIMSSTFTSSFWASSLEKAVGILEPLRSLTTIYLSTDIYHQARVPVGYVRNAIDAAFRVGIKNISLNVTYAREEDRRAIFDQYKDYGDKIMRHADRVIPLANEQASLKLLRHQDVMRALAPHAYSVKCWLSTPLINPNGDLVSCHIGKAGARKDLREVPYLLGNLRHKTFTEVMSEAEGRLDYQFLRTHGPRGVAQMVADNPDIAGSLPRRTFTTECDMCWSVLEKPAAADRLRVYSSQHGDAIRARRAIGLREVDVPNESVRTRHL